MTSDAPPSLPPPRPANAPPSGAFAPRIDAVVIGRNEGARLIACLKALIGQVGRVIYVDSGSQDGSQAQAARLGAEVIALDLSRPFTAARARNAGLAQLSDRGEFILFIDGDCQLDPDFLGAAMAHFARHPRAVAICGRRREIAPEASIYNRLCDLEWNTPLGETKACGGDVVMRGAALRAVGGYREDLIAGEEPELCQRLRRAGGEIWRIDAEMSRHDAAMTQFPQWWRRSTRAGYAFAEGAALHGRGPDRHWRAERGRALFWGAFLPLAVAFALIWQGPLGLGLALIYPLQFLRLAFAKSMGLVPAFFSLLGKFPEALGVITYGFDRLRGKKRGLIEYK